MTNEKLTSTKYIQLAKESMKAVAEDYTTEELVDLLNDESGAMFVSGYILGRGYSVVELTALKEELEALSDDELVGMIKEILIVCK